MYASDDRLARLEQRIEALEAENRRLRGEARVLSVDVQNPAVSRRALLGKFGAVAAAGAGASLLRATPAAAATGDTLKWDTNNTGNSGILFLGTDTNATVPTLNVTRVAANPGDAIIGRIGEADIPASELPSAGVHGESRDLGVGVLGESKTRNGVHGIGGGTSGIQSNFGQPAGVWGESLDGTGVFAASKNGRGLVGRSDTIEGVLGSHGAVGGPPVPPSGVLGASQAGAGVAGVSRDADGVLGATGTARGPSVSQPAGVRGDSRAGFGVIGASTQAVGVYGVSVEANAMYGQRGTASPVNPGPYAGVRGDGGARLTPNGESAVGVIGTSETAAGVLGASDIGVGVHGTSRQGAGLSAGGPRGGVLLLEPNALQRPPSFGRRGEVARDASGRLWLCNVSEVSPNPGIWVRVPAALPDYNNDLADSIGFAGVVHLLRRPFRLYDSRTVAQGGNGGTNGILGGDGKIAANTDRGINVVGAQPTAAERAVPPEALAVIGTVTATQTGAGGGWLALFPSAPRPLVSNVNWSRADENVAAPFNVVLHTGGFVVGCGPAATHFVIDITGFIA